jgi:N-glycosylase/DNA lyase
VVEFSFEDLRKMPYASAYKLLMDSFIGIGPKVADCILLFSLDKLEAFPLDTWMRKIILNLYLKNEKVKDSEIKKFCAEYFGEFAGYAEAYLFCNRVNFCQEF